MRDSGYWERRDIQEMICRTPGPFFEELEETCSELIPMDRQ